MTLEEMGALLRQERERQGISLEKAATEIKISKKYLVALEEGYTSDLPHPVYAKGFVKNYARLLGLDPEEMGKVLSTFYAVDDDHLRDAPRYEVRDSAPSIKERKVSFSSQQASSGFKPSPWLALPLLLGFAALAWYFFSSSSVDINIGGLVDSIVSRFQASTPDQSQPSKGAGQSQPKGEAKPAPQAPPSKPEATKPEASKPEPKPEPAPAAAQEQTTPLIPREILATGHGSETPKQAAVSQPAPEQNITPEKLAAEARFASSGNQTLEVNAAQPASLEVSTEDGQKRSFTLVKGQRLSLRFTDKVTVRFQLAPSVAIKLNGKDYPLEGGKADGRSIQFP